MKKKITMFTIIIAIMLLELLLPQIVKATAGYEPSGYNPNLNFISRDDVDKMGNNIIGVLRLVGTITSVAMLAVLGIKYMTGSTEEKAEYKKSMLPYFVGAILIFASSMVLTIVYNFSKNIV